VSNRKFWWYFKGRKRVNVEKDIEDRQRERQFKEERQGRKTKRKTRKKDKGERQR
jgi:hypothetical protein